MREHPTVSNLNPVWSLMRCVFAFEICLVHLILPVWFALPPEWDAPGTILPFARAGTLGFLMLAGALLVARADETVANYLPKRIGVWLRNTAIVYGIYAFYAALVGGISDIDALINNIAGLTGHLWFFWALGAVYLAVIPMRHLVRRLRPLPETARCALMVASVAAFFIGLSAITLRGGAWGNNLAPLKIAIYCGHAWTGYVVWRLMPRGSWKGVALIGIGMAVAILATLDISREAGRNLTYHNHRATLLIGLIALGQLLVILRLAQYLRRGWLSNSLERVSRLTLGIYAVHPLLIHLSGWQLWWAEVPLPLFLLLPLGGLALMAASGTAVWLAQQGLCRAGLHLARHGASIPSTPGFPPASPRHQR